MHLDIYKAMSGIIIKEAATHKHARCSIPKLRRKVNTFTAPNLPNLNRIKHVSSTDVSIIDTNHK